MTLSLPGNKTPSGNVNLSSVSSSKNVLIVELYALLNHGSVLQNFKKPTYFPNDVPKKTLLTQTLAAKALRKKFVNAIYLSVHVCKFQLPAPPLIERFTFFSFPVAKK
jgi:hypothetical protein